MFQRKRQWKYSEWINRITSSPWFLSKGCSFCLHALLMNTLKKWWTMTNIFLLSFSRQNKDTIFTITVNEFPCTTRSYNKALNHSLQSTFSVYSWPKANNDANIKRPCLLHYFLFNIISTHIRCAVVISSQISSSPASCEGCTLQRSETFSMAYPRFSR